MKEFLDILDENGRLLNFQADRDETHCKGLWHRAVSVFIVNSNNQVLLQKRSPLKQKWPNMLDISAGGHCDAGEFGYEAAIRETFEELGVKVDKQDIVFIGCTKNSFVKGDMIDNMYNEYYVANVDVDISSLHLQNDEVCGARFVTLDELDKMIKEGFKNLTPKVEAYEFLFKYMKKMQ